LCGDQLLHQLERIGTYRPRHRKKLDNVQPSIAASYLATND